MELTNLERAKYAEIIAWGVHMGSFSAYINGEICRAIQANAPSGTIYMNDERAQSVYEMKNTGLQAYILRRASKIRANFANKIAEELGSKDLVNSAFNQSVLEKSS